MIGQDVRMGTVEYLTRLQDETVSDQREDHDQQEGNPPGRRLVFIYLYPDVPQDHLRGPQRPGAISCLPTDRDRRGRTLLRRPSAPASLLSLRLQLPFHA